MRMPCDKTWHVIRRLVLWQIPTLDKVQSLGINPRAFEPGYAASIEQVHELSQTVAWLHNSAAHRLPPTPELEAALAAWLKASRGTGSQSTSTLMPLGRADSSRQPGDAESDAEEDLDSGFVHLPSELPLHWATLRRRESYERVLDVLQALHSAAAARVRAIPQHSAGSPFRSIPQALHSAAAARVRASHTSDVAAESTTDSAAVPAPAPAGAATTPDARSTPADPGPNPNLDHADGLSEEGSAEDNTALPRTQAALEDALASTRSSFRPLVAAMGSVRGTLNEAKAACEAGAARRMDGRSRRGGWHDTDRGERGARGGRGGHGEQRLTKATAAASLAERSPRDDGFASSGSGSETRKEWANHRDDALEADGFLTSFR